MNQPQTISTRGSYRRAPHEKRALLLDAARTLFVDQGFAATSTAEIAQHAGVSEGILFHHFGSKRGLYQAVAEAFAHEGANASLDAEAAELTAESVVRGAFDFADANPGLYRLLTCVSEINGPAEYAARSAIVVDAIALQLAAEIRAGRARTGDPRIMAQLQYAVVEAAYRAWSNSNVPACREQYIREAVESLQAMSQPLNKHIEPTT